LGIIQRSYINWLTISRERATTVNGQAGILRHRVAEIPPVGALFALRYGKICDSAHLAIDNPFGNPLGSSLGNDESPAMAIDDKTRTELEAAAFRRLVTHLRARADVQNIDLMNLAGFCRNCLSNWLKEEADARGAELSKDESREAVYGMPYETWKQTHQGTASPEQLAAMKKAHSGH
jgi:hypothetical protein